MSAPLTGLLINSEGGSVSALQTSSLAVGGKMFTFLRG